MNSKSKKNIEDPTKKFTSFGVSYAALEAEQKEKERASSNMVETIRNIVTTLDKNALKTHIFFLCHANYFYKNKQQFYYPAEVAFSAFSLQSGLIAAESFFIDPGQIPLGYKHEATEWSTKTHGIPINDPHWKERTEGQPEMYDKLVKFVKKFSRESGMPPFYSMFEDPLNATERLSVVECALRLITKNSNILEGGLMFQLCCLHFLTFEILKKYCPWQYVTISVVKKLLERDTFSHSKNICCSYHEKKDLSVYCSLSIVKRWVFTVCDLCCKYLKIKLVGGRHIPIAYSTRENGGTTCARENCEEEQSKNSVLPPAPFTIIDHEQLKEQRAQEKRARELFLQRAEKEVRLPKQSYRNMSFPTT